MSDPIKLAVKHVNGVTVIYEPATGRELTNVVDVTLHAGIEAATKVELTLLPVLPMTGAPYSEVHARSKAKETT